MLKRDIRFCSTDATNEDAVDPLEPRSTYKHHHAPAGSHTCCGGKNGAAGIGPA